MADRSKTTTTSRLAVWALIAFAVADVVRTVLAMGHYEQRIESVTHGNLDPLGPALYAYLLLDHLFPAGVEPSTVGNRAWGATALVAATCFVAWLCHAARASRRLDGTSASRWAAAGWLIAIGNLASPDAATHDARPAGEAPPLEQPRRPDHQIRIDRWRTLVLLTVAFVVLRLLYDLTTARGGSLHGTQFDMRYVAYPLWTIVTVLVVTTVTRGISVVRQQTQQRLDRLP
ncbi:protein of unknown function [Asanoa hainanensis]|uniref:DUF4328 domain-containing protein n=1 Tax=Asanoa hainanensis TaxID=560556 RepID=A0A239GUW0_9ACTN|nr:DUF4328 domain-containing protein [Asanoa hainanensis]SNS73006.1 protein of unknown function [Asanoa hainanensis]